MSQEDRHTELAKKTRELLQGSLKHVRTAALAAALVPFASVAVSRAVAQVQQCSSGGCPPSAPSPCDFITGGGFAFTGSAAEADFRLQGGRNKGTFGGRVNF